MPLKFNPLTGSLDLVEQTFNKTFGSVFIEAPYNDRPLIITVPIKLKLDQVVGITTRAGSLDLILRVEDEGENITSTVLDGEPINSSAVVSSPLNLNTNIGENYTLHFIFDNVTNDCKGFRCSLKFTLQ